MGSGEGRCKNARVGASGEWEVLDAEDRLVERRITTSDGDSAIEVTYAGGQIHSERLTFEGFACEATYRWEGDCPALVLPSSQDKREGLSQPIPVGTFCSFGD